MRYLVFAVISLFFAGADAALERGINLFGQPPICPSLPVKGGGCVRYVRGFDVTGVTTEIDLTFPQIKDECDCIQACLNAKETCDNYVWKFSTPQSVMSGFRTCTLYSSFNLPLNVTIKYAAKSHKNINLQPLNPANNPQAGALVPQAFKDVNLNTTVDNDAVSGPLWLLADGSVVC